MIRRTLEPLFEGGPAGQRQAALFFVLCLAPASLVVGAVLSTDHQLQVAVLRGSLYAVTVCWLWFRTAFRFGEWVLLIAVFAFVNVAASLEAGVAHNGVSALNGMCTFAVACIVLEARLVLITAAFFSAGYAGVQFHFYSPGDAAAATVMYLVGLAVVAVVVYGTAHYLRDSLRRVGELHAEMERTAERERARIAGELHDDTIQVLTAAGFRLDELARSTANGGDAHRATLTHEVRDMIRHALDRTRKLSFELYPSELDQVGLRTALAALASRIEADSGFSVTLSVTSGRFPHTVEQLTYRTIKELLTNARKHSQAHHVAVTVTSDNGGITGTVKDDGRGFDTGAVAAARENFHIGLEAAAERVRSAGGTLEVTSAPHRGTRATFTLPTS